MPSPLNVFRAKPKAAVPATLPKLAQDALPVNYLGGSLSTWSDLQAALSETRVATEAMTLGLPVAWRCVNLIANAVATMMASANVYQGSQELEVPGIIQRPNNLYTSYEFWFEAVVTTLIHGNWIAIKAGYVGDFPTQLVPVHPDNVECRIAQNGYPLYRIGDTYYGFNDVVHVRGLTLPGQWWGLGVIEAQRRSLVASVDMQTYSHSTYRTGAVPTVVIQLKGRNISQESLEQVSSDWQNAHGSGQRRPVIVPGESMEINPLAWSPEDAQFLQARMLNIAEHAFIWGLSPSDLDTAINGNANTYANIEQRNIERITSSYGPWLYRFEQAFSDLLPGTHTVKGNPEALLRTDTLTRYQAHRIANPNAVWLTDDEIRALENRPPLPKQEAPTQITGGTQYL